LTQQRVEGFDPEDIWVENTVPKLREMDSATAVRSSGFAEFVLHGGDRVRGDAAGDDQVEVGEVGVLTLRAKPWEVTEREMWTPMAASLASGAGVRGGARKPKVPRLQRTILRIVLFRSG
jgi:hypothetical protein